MDNNIANLDSMDVESESIDFYLELIHQGQELSTGQGDGQQPTNNSHPTAGTGSGTTATKTASAAAAALTAVDVNGVAVPPPEI